MKKNKNPDTDFCMAVGYGYAYEYNAHLPPDSKCGDNHKNREKL